MNYSYYFWKLFSAACIFFLILAGIPCQAANTDGLQVLFRYDDYSRFSNSKFEERLFDTIASMGATLLVSVIPFPGESYPNGNNPFLDPKAELGKEKVALVKKYTREGVVEIALHGYSHRNNFQNGHSSSEFAGLPATQQRHLLKIGKVALETSLEIPIDIFVPPFNTYDLNTISALEAVGFKLLSAGGGGPCSQNSKILYLPGTTYPQYVRSAVTAACTIGVTDGFIIITMHSYDFDESGQKLPDFRRHEKQIDLKALRYDIEWIKKQPGVSIVSCKQPLHKRKDLSGVRLKANTRVKSSLITRQGLIPNLPWLYPSYQVYYSQEIADRIYSRQIWVCVGIYGILFALSLAVPWHLLRTRPRKFVPLVRPVRIALVTLISLVIIYASMNGFYMKAAMAVIFSIGWLIGISVALLRKKGIRGESVGQ